MSERHVDFDAADWAPDGLGIGGGGEGKKKEKRNEWVRCSRTSERGSLAGSRRQRGDDASFPRGRDCGCGGRPKGGSDAQVEGSSERGRHFFFFLLSVCLRDVLCVDEGEEERRGGRGWMGEEEEGRESFTANDGRTLQSRSVWRQDISNLFSLFLFFAFSASDPSRTTNEPQSASTTRARS